MAGYWPDIEKSRAEARRLLKEAGAEGLTFELLNRNVDQPYKFNAPLGHRRVEQDRRQGDSARACRPGPLARRCAAASSMRCSTAIARTSSIRCSTAPSTCRIRSRRSNYGNYEDPAEVELYDRMLRETDFARQRELMRQFEKLVLDTEAHEIFLLWRYRIVPYRSYVKGWKVSPSHYVNQDLATIWLDK